MFDNNNVATLDTSNDTLERICEICKSKADLMKFHGKFICNDCVVFIKFLSEEE